MKICIITKWKLKLNEKTRNEKTRDKNIHMKKKIGKKKRTKKDNYIKTIVTANNNIIIQYYQMLVFLFDFYTLQ